MSKASELKTRTAYADLMEEVKLRLDAIHTTSRGDTGLAVGFVQDFCYLQLRMIVELIALACLAAHGDISETHGLTASWDADKIFKALANLHPDYFPYPVRREILANGTLHLNDVPPGYLTKDEVLGFLGKIGGKLHRGSLKNVLKNINTVQHHFPDIVRWTDKIVLLLNEHRIMFFDNRSLYYCALNDASVGNRVLVAHAAAPP